MVPPVVKGPQDIFKVSYCQDMRIRDVQQQGGLIFMVLNPPGLATQSLTV